MDSQNQNPRNKTNFLGTLADKIVSVLPFIIAVLIILAAVAFCYNFIYGIVVSITAKAFRIFVTSFATAIGSCAQWLFFAVLLSVLKKILDK